MCADITESSPIAISNHFDIVFAADVLFHIIEDKRFERAISSMASRLKVDGWLIVSDIFPQQTVQSATHVRLRSYSDYYQIFLKHKLSIVQIEPIFAILQPPPIKSHLAW